jgi:hypothetical protein
MREIIFTVIAMVLGASAGASVFWLQTRNEDNRFEIFKTDGSLPTNVLDPQEGTPVVRVEGGNTFDFGTMGKNQTMKHTFVIHNDGDYPLQIKLLETSCKCTLADVDEEEILPGESRDLTLEWTPEDYSEQFGQNARIQTNDPKQRILQLRVEGRVSVPVRPFPEELVVTRIPVAEGFSQYVDLLAYETQDLRVTDVVLTDKNAEENFDFEIRPLTSEDEPLKADATVKSGVRVTVSGKPGLPLGPLLETLKITTNQSADNVFEVPLMGRVVGNYELKVSGGLSFDENRSLIDLGQMNVNATKTVDMNIFIRGEDADSAEISVESDDIDPSENIKVEIGEKKKIGALVTVPLKLTVQGNGQSLSRLGPNVNDLGRITIHTTDETTPIIQLFIKFALTE